MKLVSAVITPAQFEAVHKALDTFRIPGLTFTEVLRRDTTVERGDQVYRGQRFHTDLIPHIRLDLVTPDHDTRDVVHIITTLTSAGGCTGSVWITHVEKLAKIRTGERGSDAL
jgi:nitrogen regulatory protein P-II 1